VTSLPDWLVERAALDEIAPHVRGRLERADRDELAARIAALRADNAAELAAHPARPAIVQITQAIAAKRRGARRRGFAVLGVAAATVVVLVVFAGMRRTDQAAPPSDPEITRVKGPARLLAFRQAGEHAERLEPDAIVRAGDTVQLRYNAGGKRYGVIASIDGAGIVTLHHPSSEDAPPEATALASKLTALPNAYVLDDAPRFERFFFITADAAIDVQQSLASLRSFARRSDCASASLELPSGYHQWSLRLRKPSPTP
jgi:hypothetical protein